MANVPKTFETIVYYNRELPIKQLSILIWKYRSTFRTLFEQQNFVYELQPVSDIKSYCYKISHIPPVRLHCSHVMLQ